MNISVGFYISCIFIFLINYSLSYKYYRFKKKDKNYLEINVINATEFDTVTEIDEQTQDNFNAVNFLKKYGYFEPKNNKSSKIKSMIKLLDDMPDPLENTIKKYQRLNHLNVTGVLDEQTINKMKSPRCGVSDIISQDHYKTRSKRDNSEFFQLWDKTNLTYKIINSTSDLDHKVIKDSISKAFGYWSNASSFNFVETDNENYTDILISFEEGDHDDGSPFDGFGRELAHAFYPRDSRIHFDDAEHFTENSTTGVNLRLMATHEIGHALGLTHNFEPTSIMYPEYNGYIENFSLSEYDLNLVKRLFNHEHNQVTVSPVTIAANVSEEDVNDQSHQSVTTNTKRTLIQILFKGEKEKTNEKLVKQDSPCNSRLQIIFLGHTNTIYALSKDDESIWEYNLVIKKWLNHPLKVVFPQWVKGILGGVKCEKNRTWFFKDRKVWAYEENKLLPTFPTQMNYVRMRPFFSFTVVSKNKQIYLVKNGKAFYFNTTTLTLINENPVDMSDLFPGVPSSIDAFFEFGSYAYFFTDIWLYRFNLNTNKVEDGDPKLKSETLFLCLKKQLKFNWRTMSFEKID